MLNESVGGRRAKFRSKQLFSSAWLSPTCGRETERKTKRLMCVNDSRAATVACTFRRGVPSFLPSELQPRPVSSTTTFNRWSEEPPEPPPPCARPGRPLPPSLRRREEPTPRRRAAAPEMNNPSFCFQRLHRGVKLNLDLKTRTGFSF